MVNSRINLRLLLRSLFAAGMLTLACGIGARAEGTLDKIKREGIFLAGVRFDSPPVGTVDLSGNPVGFGPDLAKAIADALGVKVKFVQVNSQTRVPMLLNGQIDADFDLATPYKQREETVDFTIPYVWDSTTILVRKGSDLDPTHYGPPKQVATTQGSSNNAVLLAVVPDAKFQYFQEYPDAIAALRNQKVDAVVLNRSLTAKAIKSDPNLVAGDDIGLDPWAVMLRQDDSKWRNFLNWTMQELWAKGQYQTMYAKWFGEAPRWHMWSEYELQPGIGTEQERKDHK
jgi:polar amino acid transport system substrate-binding protein